MRLWIKLALAFASLSLLPPLFMAPWAATLDRTLSLELQSRIDRSYAAAAEELTLSRQSVRQAMEELAESVALEDVARNLKTSTPAQLAPLAEKLMSSRHLSVLSLLDTQGTTLSSGHLPARVGDLDNVLFAATQPISTEPIVRAVEVRDGTSLTERPALLLARPVEYGESKLWVIGGEQLDPSWAGHLSRLTGAEVSIQSKGRVVAHAGEAPPPVMTRELRLSDEATIVLGFSGAAFKQAEKGLFEAVAKLAAIGLLLAVGAGVLVARLVTRPVDALVQGARRVKDGDWSTSVPEKSGGELGELIRAFNSMTSTLRETTERLVATERVAAWQEMAKRLAHELKNPLTPIKMSIETLLAARGSPRFNTLFAESAGPLLEEVDRLRRTVDAFSHFARLPKPQMERLDLSAHIKQVMALHGTGRAKIQVETELNPGLFVNADKDQLSQVLVNLLKNAIEAMPEGGALRVRASERGSDVVVEVSDSGKGISPTAKAQLFTPYFTTKEGGTGLGLALSSRICQEHGGRLEVDSEPGKGATFRFAIPRAV